MPATTAPLVGQHTIPKTQKRSSMCLGWEGDGGPATMETVVRSQSCAKQWSSRTAAPRVSPAPSVYSLFKDQRRS